MKATHIYTGLCCLLVFAVEGVSEEAGEHLQPIQTRYQIQLDEGRRLSLDFGKRMVLVDSTRTKIDVDDSEQHKYTKIEEVVEKAVARQLAEIAGYLEEYRKLSGSYPTTNQGLDALVTKPKNEPFPRRWIQHCVELPRDIFGRYLKYELKNGKFRLWSLGKDLKDAGDDIKYQKPNSGEQVVPPRSDRAGG